MIVMKWLRKNGKYGECSSRTCHAGTEIPKKACRCYCGGFFHGLEPMKASPEIWRRAIAAARRRAAAEDDTQLVIYEQLELLQEGAQENSAFALH